MKLIHYFKRQYQTYWFTVPVLFDFLHIWTIFYFGYKLENFLFTLWSKWMCFTSFDQYDLIKKLVCYFITVIIHTTSNFRETIWKSLWKSAVGYIISFCFFFANHFLNKILHKKIKRNQRTNMYRNFRGWCFELLTTTDKLIPPFYISKNTSSYSSSSSDSSFSSSSFFL